MLPPGRDPRSGSVLRRWLLHEPKKQPQAARDPPPELFLVRHGRGRQAISSMRARAYACVCVFIVYAYISLLIPRAPLMESPRQLPVGGGRSHTDSRSLALSTWVVGGAAAGGSTSAQRGACRGVLASWAGTCLRTQRTGHPAASHAYTRHTRGSRGTHGTPDTARRTNYNPPPKGLCVRVCKKTTQT